MNSILVSLPSFLVFILNKKNVPILETWRHGNMTWTSINVDPITSVNSNYFVIYLMWLISLGCLAAFQQFDEIEFE